MKSKAMRLTAGLGGLLATAVFGYGIIQAAEQPGGGASSETASTAVMPIEQVLAELRQQGYADIHEIEHEGRRYEVKAKDASGKRVELYLDARTGETLKSEDEDD